MAWIIPTAGEIFAKISASLETGILAIRPDLSPLAISRAVRSARGVFSQIGRAVAAELREVHDHQAYWARQYMPDSADDDAMIFRHASIWGTEQRGALTAIGSVMIEGIAGTVLPAGIELSASNAALYVTTASATIGLNGTVIVPASASEAGTAGNLESGIRLATVTSYPEISRVTIATALSGGADEQTPAEIKAAYLQRIRQAPHGGAGFDYPVWVAQVASVKAVAVVPDWIGYGSVGIVLIMRDDDGSARVPTEAEIALVQNHLGPPSSRTGVKPVTSRTVVVGGQLTPVPLTIRLRPDTAATRAAVTDAYARFIATIGDDDDAQNDSPIGALIERSRISEAISSAAGEYAHDLIVPAAAYTLQRTQYPVPAAIIFED
ncbi:MULTISPECIES: baseplate J/gp47 family protein [unclassified Rhizobium]|uniref:baseplate J/gp47 family protein n=1 Tax=unclassified Rhizobium TaxID=2613769 RepID=UPI001780FB21|nr:MULTISPECIES: baseplate J/gp47 family protein [unclassified Rhizobium]MBD8686565.1 baseplate J/gp47 family protein [Rhizobium sp. CFBP 13644]MBD8691633.1 baseplate J/gp47 family protein [Rhizobium sp. CFBP 13717]